MTFNDLLNDEVVDDILYDIPTCTAVYTPSERIKPLMRLIERRDLNGDFVVWLYLRVFHIRFMEHNCLSIKSKWYGDKYNYEQP